MKEKVSIYFDSLTCMLSSFFSFYVIVIIVVINLVRYKPWFNWQEIETYNTRLFKEVNDEHVIYILRVASVATTGESSMCLRWAEAHFEIYFLHATYREALGVASLETLFDWIQSHWRVKLFLDVRSNPNQNL